jgi:hypothetical protein
MPCYAAFATRAELPGLRVRSRGDGTADRAEFARRPQRSRGGGAFNGSFSTGDGHPGSAFSHTVPVVTHKAAKPRKAPHVQVMFVSFALFWPKDQA